MATDKPDLREAVRRLAESRRPREHPAPEKLAEYHARELPAEEVPALQDHLAECSECSQLLLDLESFEDLEPPAGRRPVPDSQVRRDWKRLRKRLRSQDGPSRVEGSGDRGSAERRATKPELARHRTPLRGSGSLLAVAAAVVVIGVGIWVVGTHLGSSGGLIVNVPPVELYPVGARTTRSGALPAPARGLFAAGAYLVLHDAPAPSPASGGYEVVIRDADTGAVRYRDPGLRPLDGGFFTLVIEPGVLSAGDYRIEVRSAGPEPEVVRTYALTVAEPRADSGTVGRTDR